jgi:single-strand DNA-binding protein
MAASLNRIILCGNLTADPELAYAPSGMAICKLRLAVNERVKNSQTGEWTDRPCYVDVTVFGNQAEPCNQYLNKGAPVLLEGKLRYETWETPEGAKRSKHSVVAERVQFIAPREDGGAARPSAPAQRSVTPAQATAPSPPPADESGDDEDLPF